MSLSYLPNELLVHIFKSVDNVSDAAALSRTSQRFHKIYEYSISSICDAVLPRTTEAYDQAAQLFEARTYPAALSSDDWQTIRDTVYPPENESFPMFDTFDRYERVVSLFQAGAKSKITSSQSSADDKPVAALKRAKKLLADADLVQSALHQFEIFISQFKGPPESLKRLSPLTGPPNISSLEPFTRARFLQGYYRAISLIYMRKKTGAEMYQFLASMSLLDLFCMCEVMVWLTIEFAIEYSMPLDTPGTIEFSTPLNTPGSILMSDWLSLPNEMRCLPGHIDLLVGDEEHDSWRHRQVGDGWSLLLDLVEDLETITGIEGPQVVDLIAPPEISNFDFILHSDGLDERPKKAEEVALADVLALLPIHEYDYRIELPGRH